MAIDPAVLMRQQAILDRTVPLRSIPGGLKCTCGLCHSCRNREFMRRDRSERRTKVCACGRRMLDTSRMCQKCAHAQFGVRGLIARGVGYFTDGGGI